MSVPMARRSTLHFISAVEQELGQIAECSGRSRQADFSHLSQAVFVDRSTFVTVDHGRALVENMPWCALTANCGVEMRLLAGAVRWIPNRRPLTSCFCDTSCSIPAFRHYITTCLYFSNGIIETHRNSGTGRSPWNDIDAASRWLT